MTNSLSPIIFFSGFTPRMLQRFGIFNKLTYELNGKSVAPLIGLMKQAGIKQLQQDRWFLDIDYEFLNPHAIKARYKNNVHNLKTIEDGQGTVFQGQNSKINPHYRHRKNPVRRHIVTL